MRANNLREVMAKPILEDSQTELENSGRNLGYLFAALGTMLFSMKAVFVKMAYLPVEGAAVQTGDPITLMFVRMMTCLPIYLIIMAVLLRRRKKQGATPLDKGQIIKAIMVGALGYYICSFLDFTGLQYITANLERMILYTYPAYVIILGAIFFGKKLSKWGVLSILLAYAGIALIFSSGEIATGSNVALGSMLVMGCAFCFGLSQLLSKPVIDKLGGGMFTCVAMLSASAMVILHYVIGKVTVGDMQAVLQIDPQVLTIGVIIGVFCTVIPSFLVNFGMARIGAQSTAAMGMVSPIVTIVAAVILLGEPFGGFDALGTFVTIFGIGIYTFVDKRRTKAAK